MRLSTPRDLGLYIRDRRRFLGITQDRLGEEARVSRRWLSEIEAGKPTAEIGLVFNVLHALNLTLEASPTVVDSDDLDDFLDDYGRRETGRTNHD
jgi:HTH-type transcriptional regulator / antitoxin HipB